MGVTYIKLGQYLAIRYDLLPPEICRELANLLSEVPPLDFAIARQVVEIELGASLESRFSEFELRPVGAASIAQVHRATAIDGQVLAVKIQRPGIEALLYSDFRNLLRLAWISDKLRLMGAISLVNIIQEVEEYTLREADFVQEGQMADLIRMESPTYVKVPEIRWDLTTRHVLSMEFIDGVSLLTICTLGDRIGEAAFNVLLPGVDPHQVVSNLAEACLRQLFVTGHFHGDPHLANVLVGRDGAISFIDFGIFGTLDADQRKTLAEFMFAMTAGYDEKAYRCYLRLATPTDNTDLRLFHRDMIAVLRKWRTAVADPSAATSERLSVGFQTQVLEIMRRCQVRSEPNQILFWRTLGWLDVMAYRLPVESDLLKVMGRFFRATQPSVLERVSNILLDTARTGETVELAGAVPDLGRRLLANRDRPVRVLRNDSAHVRENANYASIAAALVATACAIVLAALGTLG
jgi:ubiquinone biosynthesis protein